MMLDRKFIVSDEVEFMIEGEFVEQKQEQTASAATAWHLAGTGPRGKPAFPHGSVVALAPGRIVCDRG